MTAWRSPIPYLAGICGVGLGFVGLGFLGLVVGADVCTDCHDFDLRWGIGGAALGAALGSVAGTAAGAWAVSRSPRTMIAAAAIVGFLLVGGAGAWAATDVWQRTHPDQVLRVPRPCRRLPTLRPDWCSGPRGEVRPEPLPGPSMTAVPAVTAAGGLVAGSIGAAAAAALQTFALRRGIAADTAASGRSEDVRR